MLSRQSASALANEKSAACLVRAGPVFGSLDTQRGELHHFEELVNDQDGYVRDTSVGVLRASLGQIRVIVEHSN